MRSRRLILTFALALAACVTLDSWANAQRSRGSSRSSSGSVQRSRGSSRPSARPSQSPSSRPSARPSSRPSSRPSARPSSSPSSRPTSRPSPSPSSRPSYTPSSRADSTPSYRRSSPSRADSTPTDRRSTPTLPDRGSDSATRDWRDTGSDLRDLGRPVGRPDGPSGSVRDALDDLRPTTERGGSVFERTKNGTTTTLRRPFARDVEPDSAIVDLRPASRPEPVRVRFPRSYSEGERLRRAQAERDGRLDAVERDRLYRARAAGRDAARRSDFLRDSGRLSDVRQSRDATREPDARSALGDVGRERLRRAADGSLSRGDRSVREGIFGDRRSDRARRDSGEPPRLSQGRIDRIREARRRAAAAGSSSAGADPVGERRERAYRAHLARARTDARYASRVRTDQEVLQAATNVVVNAGIGIGVTLGGGGWSANFAVGTGYGYDCYPYVPSWCGPPLYYGWNACVSWGYDYWWWRPFCRPYYSYRPSIGFWWGPWCTGYWGSTVIVEQPVREIVYVEERYADDEWVEAPPADAAAAPAPRGTAPTTSSEALRRSAGRYLELGDDAFLQGEYGRAVHYYAKAIELSPDDGVLYLVLSDALFATGDYHYAAYALRRAFELEPELSRMKIDKRDLYSDPSDFERQLAQLELYLEDHYLDADARLVLAANYLYGGAPGRAIVLLDDPFSTEVVESPAGAMLRQAAMRALQEK